MRDASITALACAAAVFALLTAAARADDLECSGAECTARDLAAAGLDCLEDVCIDLERTSKGDRFFAVNRRNGPATIRFGLPVMENLVASQPLPLSVVVAPHSRRALLRTRVANPKAAWKRQYQWHWRLGVLHAPHDADSRYRLPFAADQRIRVTQAVGGAFSHTGKDRHSFDFAMPVGTAVRATRAGTVVEVVERHKRGGPDPRLKRNANWIGILHADGTLGRYVHLRHRGAEVTVGDAVSAGDVIGFSGNTGYSSLPHLHFSVVTVDDALDWKSVPIRFDDGTRLGFVPVAGQRVGSSAASLPARAAR
jgi:murein DD-endopeptidase MepM/ murein hydrolase activator NlpD